MAVEVMAWVWNHSRTKNSARLVLLAIADCASGDGTNAWPSNKELCRKTRLTDRSVQSAIQQCIELGELDVELNGGRRGTNMYTVLMRTPEDLSPPKKARGEDPAPPKNVRGSAKSQVSSATPEGSSAPEKSSGAKNLRPTPEESSDGTVQEPSGERESLFPDLGAEANAPTPDALFEAFWSAYPKKKAKGDARKAWGQVLKRGAEPHTIVAAAHQYARERDGEDPQYTAYPATWLRSERYADEPDPMYQPPRQRAGSHQPYRNPTTYGSNPDPWA
ncbi:helix-turn-helix domain-containing protein [Nocardiopsis exhalans]|uniref:Helix-turn-helix domain-containing protein n=1 Tax=Nocardiopsis exhalans TaxID=163604 RepID=A0ABY5DDG1_9ACTN|nr:helix-turn-helix domain-containing protein [Nocardiopsis exhalans]USY21801.1 helix-turn-helix domain-containing protein [Nocardiopsis exhalans]